MRMKFFLILIWREVYFIIVFIIGFYWPVLVTTSDPEMNGRLAKQGKAVVYTW